MSAEKSTAPAGTDTMQTLKHMSRNEFEEVTDFTEETQQFTIDTDNAAEWALEKIREHAAERDRLLKIADTKISEYQRAREKVVADYQNNTSYLTSLLRMYFESVKPSSVTKTQAKYKLLTGALVMKKQQPEYVRDEQTMVDWARANAPGYIKVSESINWGELKKKTVLDGEAVVLEETGEVVPGVVAKERPDVFEVVQ